MTTIMRSAAAAAVSLFVAFMTVGCDDVGGGGGGGGTTTTITGGTSTTSSTTSSSLTTTTGGGSTTTAGPTTTSIGPTTTTTIPVTANVGSLQWDTNYSAAGGGFDGAAGTVSCTSLIAGALAAFNDVEATTILTSGIITTTGFTIPADVSRCDFTTTGATAPTVGQFAISNVIATDPEGANLDVNVIVSNIACTPSGGVQDCQITFRATPVTPTTTTTVVVTTTTGPTTTTTTGVSALVGSLQFNTDYSGAGGGFDGAAGTVACQSLVSGALAAFNDVEATSTLTSGIITVSGFTIPTDISRCNFTTTGATAPTAGDFAISGVEATDPEGGAVSVNVIVTNVACTPSGGVQDCIVTFRATP